VQPRRGLPVEPLPLLQQLVLETAAAPPFQVHHHKGCEGAERTVVVGAALPVRHIGVEPAAWQHEGDQLACSRLQFAIGLVDALQRVGAHPVGGQDA
jgi:hypothetical protein